MARRDTSCTQSASGSRGTSSDRKRRERPLRLTRSCAAAGDSARWRSRPPASNRPFTGCAGACRRGGRTARPPSRTRCSARRPVPNGPARSSPPARWPVAVRRRRRTRAPRSDTATRVPRRGPARSIARFTPARVPPAASAPPPASACLSRGRPPQPPRQQHLLGPGAERQLLVILRPRHLDQRVQQRRQPRPVPVRLQCDQRRRQSCPAAARRARTANALDHQLLIRQPPVCQYPHGHCPVNASDQFLPDGRLLNDSRSPTRRRSPTRATAELPRPLQRLQQSARSIGFPSRRGALRDQRSRFAARSADPRSASRGACREHPISVRTSAIWVESRVSRAAISVRTSAISARTSARPVLN